MMRTSLISLTALLLCPSLAPAQFVVGVDQSLGMDDGEITPDGRFGVIRMNAFAGSLRLYDMQTGGLLEDHGCAFFSTGENQDSVAVTNDRAISIGDCAYIADLNAAGTPQFIIGHHELGSNARDVAITPNGKIAAVAGGSPGPKSLGGLFLFDLETGDQLAWTAGLPSNAFSTTYSTALDTVAVTDSHAVFLSLQDLGTPLTRVTIFALENDAGAPPGVVFQTGVGTGLAGDLDGAPSDLAITPDGKYVAVRSEFEVALYPLAGKPTGAAWRHTPVPGSMGLQNAAMDTIVATNSRVATISPWGATGFFTQLDLLDLAGNRAVSVFGNEPHDLVVTPSQERLLVRTRTPTLLFDMNADLVTGFIDPLSGTAVASTHTGYQAGLDSIVATDELVAIVSRVNGQSDVSVFDISEDSFVPVSQHLMPEPATDLALTPDSTRLVLSSNSYLEVLDLRSDTVVLSHDIAGAGFIPWSDGVVTNDTHALVWGVNGSQSGWVATVDLFAAPVTYCEAQNNSTGTAAHIHATGSASIGSNDLSLWATGLPSSAPALLVYGSDQRAVPFGNGTSCVAGTVHRFPLGVGQPNGLLAQGVDVTGAPTAGGAITAGSTWNFQFLYRDGELRQTTDGVTVTFLP